MMVRCVMCCVVLIGREGVEKASRLMELRQGLDQVAIRIVTSGLMSEWEPCGQSDVKRREPPTLGWRVHVLVHREFIVMLSCIHGGSCR